MANIGIMQPYFLPYIGYFQLIAHVDRFVVYDRIEYTKKGWVNRNRMLRNGMPATFSIPLAKASDHLDVRERKVAESFDPIKLANQFRGAYAKAPHFKATMPLLETILKYQSQNLFDFIFYSLEQVCNFLKIDTPLDISSQVESSSNLRGQDRVLGICNDLKASTYTNPIGGLELYEANAFLKNNVELRFLQTRDITYHQFHDSFEPALSIVDVMMFNPPEQIAKMLRNEYDILEKDDV